MVFLRTSKSLVAFAAVVLLCCCSTASVSALEEFQLDGFEDNVVLQDLGTPTAFAWTTPDGGQLLVTNKMGQLYVFDDPLQDNSYSVQTTALDLSLVMCDNSERGLHGVEAHPDFETNRFIYLYYTYNKNGNCDEDPFIGPVNRLSRFVLPLSNLIDITTEEVFFETPSLEYDHHNSGDIAFGKDGYLYVSVGDGGSTFDAVAQNLGNLFGTIVRVTADNEIPKGNPYTFESGEVTSVRCHVAGKVPSGSPEGAKCQEIYHYGLRNPFRFAMDPNTEANNVRFFINDVGQRTWEEIDEGGDDFVGANYGWPDREGPCPNSKEEDCDDDHPFQDPFHYYYHDEDGGGAVTGGAFVPNGLWAEEFDGAYVYAEYVWKQLYLLRPGDDECRSCNPPNANKPFEIITSYDKILTVAFGPHGDTQALYYCTLDGALRRVTYIGNGNRSPEAVILANPISGPVGVTVQFSAAGSSDAEGDELRFGWDFDSDGVVDSINAVDSYTYNMAGVQVVTLTVMDGQGGKRSTAIEISVGSKPIVIIGNPPEGATFAVGDILTLTGSATDAESGNLLESLLVWEVRQHHNTHYHPFLDLTSGNNIVLQAAPEPEDYDAATSSYLEIILTATDADGLSTTVTRNVQPRTVLIDFDTVPSGLDILVDGSPLTTPKTATTWEGHTLRVIAQNQGDGINTYIFDSWSDESTQGLEILVPPASETAMLPAFVARFDVVSGTGSPTVAPTELPKCIPQALLIYKQIIQDGDYSLNEEAGVYMEQRDDGILAVVRGTPENPGDTLWQNIEESGPIGHYYTKMMGDANVIVKGGTPENKTKTFWSTKSAQTVSGDYFFGIGCDGLLSIYQGTYKNPGIIIWNAEPTPSPTFSPSGAATTVASSQSPTSSTLATSAPVVPTEPELPPTASPSHSPTAATLTTSAPVISGEPESPPTVTPSHSPTAATLTTSAPVISDEPESPPTVTPSHSPTAATLTTSAPVMSGEPESPPTVTPSHSPTAATLTTSAPVMSGEPEFPPTFSPSPVGAPVVLSGELGLLPTSSPSNTPTVAGVFDKPVSQPTSTPVMPLKPVLDDGTISEPTSSSSSASFYAFGVFLLLAAVEFS